jgi:single-strand DNA-binding protein
LGESFRQRTQDGQLQTHTNWHNLTFYDDLAEVAATYEQGENIFAEGTMQQRKFTPKDGATRTVHEVIVRACHVIERPRTERLATEGLPTKTDSLQVATVELVEGEGHDATWPV